MARWDCTLSDGTLLKPASLTRMWTTFPLANGKSNSARDGFGWFMDELTCHPIIEHGEAWQGFAADMTRYPDEDGLTGVVFANRDASHARSRQIARVVAGFVSPELMPAPAKAIPTIRHAPAARATSSGERRPART